MSRIRVSPTALSALTGAGLLLVVDLVEVHGNNSAGELARSVAAHSDRWMVSYSLQMLGALLLMAGVVGLMRDARGRGGRLTRFGACWFAAGLVGLVAEAATELMLIPVTADGASTGALATVHRMDESNALTAVFLLYLPGVVFGPLLLAAGLARARRTTWAVAAVFSLATIAGFALNGTIVGTVALSIQLGILVWWSTRSGAPVRTEDDLEPARQPAVALS